MPIEPIDKKTKWECQRCAKCCRDIIVSKQKSLSLEINGKIICKNLDLNTLLCKDYENRPFTCKIYPFVIDINAIVKDKVATPQDAFKLENLKIHTECPGYGKGKRIFANKNLKKKIDKIAYDFALKFKECFEKGEDISKIL